MKQVLIIVLSLLSLSYAAYKHAFVKCETTKGPLLIEVYPEWAPIGATRFLDLVYDQFYTNIAFFRSVEGFLTQFGISDNPDKQHWHSENIPDDINLNLGIQKFDVAFAGAGPNTRSTQLFIAYEDQDHLGKEPWETPIGRVVDGEETLYALYKGYEDIPPFGNGPDQERIYQEGNHYIRENFPLTDFLLSCEFAGFAEAEAEVEENEEDNETLDDVKGPIDL